MRQLTPQDDLEAAPEAALAQALSAAFPDPPAAIGLAVSGGSDSTALAALMAGWAAPRGIRLCAITIDHALRPASATEAQGVAAFCATIGIAHDIRRWDGWDGRGNLMERARGARGALIADWAVCHGLAVVALGHTQDDQAETLLLNLARGSGVDGLSAMPAVRREGAVTWLRPLLDLRREALRDWLRGRGIGWTEDPSNDDSRFARVRVRAAIPALGLDVVRLAATAARMQGARYVLERVGDAALARLARVEAGDVVFSPALLDELPEIRDRILSRAIVWVGGQAHRPRRADLSRVVAMLAQRRCGTLAGCRIIGGDAIRVGREGARVAALRAPAPGRWDGRWRVTGPAGPEIAALGAVGLSFRPDWRDVGVPRATLIASPALWQDGALIAAPLLDPDRPYRAEVDTDALFAPRSALNTPLQSLS